MRGEALDVEPRHARLRRAVARAQPVVTSPWLRVGVLVLTLVVAMWSIEQVPSAAPLPVLLGVLPWTVGKYVLCPLRWHGLAASGQGRWWHIRAYAESELLGLLSPAHAGADVWRVHRLHRTGMPRTAAVAGVAIDRLVGAVGIAFGVAATGTTLPRPVLLALAGIVAGAVALVLVIRSRRPGLLTAQPLPGPRPLALGLLLSLGYQISIVGLVLGAVVAVGYPVDPLSLLVVFGASQVAGIVPGIGGASPRNGALAVGLTSLGVTWTAALAAVSLVALLPWAPALLLGGSSFAVRRLAALRPAPA